MRFCILVQGPDDTSVRRELQENGDGTFTVLYTPKDVGSYTVAVEYGGQPIPGAPFTIRTSPRRHAAKLKIPGNH